jgi:hypothetical protein
LDPADPNTVLAGGSSLIVSNDGGTSWSSFPTNGIEDVLYYKILTGILSPQKTFLLGTDRGVFSYTVSTSVGGPEIKQVLPAQGRAGDSVAIRGSRFGASQGDSRISFGSIDAGTAASWSDTSITARIPSEARSGGVSVTVSGRKSNSYDFVVIPSAGVIAPASGPSAGGTRVTIASPAGANSLAVVLFGSTVARNVRLTPPNLITCVSPPGSGTVNVRLLQGPTLTSLGTFTYQ